MHSRVSSVKLLSAQSGSAGAYSASNKTQCINVWQLFLIAITGILDEEHVLSSLFPPKSFCIFAEVITHGFKRGLATGQAIN